MGDTDTPLRSLPGRKGEREEDFLFDGLRKQLGGDSHFSKGTFTDISGQKNSEMVAAAVLGRECVFIYDHYYKNKRDSGYLERDFRLGTPVDISNTRGGKSCFHFHNSIGGWLGFEHTLDVIPVNIVDRDCAIFDEAFGKDKLKFYVFESSAARESQRVIVPHYHPVPAFLAMFRNRKWLACEQKLKEEREFKVGKEVFVWQEYHTDAL